MHEREYVDFELCIEKAGLQYRASVVHSPVGEAAHTFDQPFPELELENFVLRLAASRRGTRRISSPEMKQARQFGTKLFETVFRGDIRASFVSCQYEARRRGQGLRLKLRLDAPELINIPWEYLYDGSQGRFLSLFEDTPIVRYVDMPGRIAPLCVEPPLSVLVMISSPKDYPSLEVEREQANLREAVQGLVDADLLTITWVESATLPALAVMLLRGKYHVFHYIGHGGFDERSQDGVLVLEDEEGRGRLTSGERLAVLLGNHRTMRLAILNACEGARTAVDDPFAGTAMTLVKTGGVPAVVAMQVAITDEAAVTFAHGFYSALSVGRPVDAAVTQARLAIFAGGNDVEWGTPVLYMRSPDGRLFDMGLLQPEDLAERQMAAAAARREREEAERRAQEERRAQLSSLYERAAASMAERDWVGAVELFSRIQGMAPGYRDAVVLLAESQAAVERQEQRARLHAAARDNLVAGRLTEAIEGLQAVLEMDSTFGDAARELAEAQEKLARQEAEKRAQAEEDARQIQLARLYGRADEAARAGDWQAATEHFAAILAMDEGFQDTAARLVEAQEALAAVEAGRQQRLWLADLYERATDRMATSDWVEAERLLREIRDVDPSYRDAETLLAQTFSRRGREKRLAITYARAETAVDRRDWHEAERLLLEVRSTAPDYRDTGALLAQVASEREREDRLSSLYGEAEEAFHGRSDWSKAAALYGQVLAEQAGYRDAQAKWSESLRQQHLAEQFSQAREHYEGRRWKEAVEGFRAIVEVDPDYNTPSGGDVTTLLGAALGQKERSELPAPPVPRQRKPVGLAEEIVLRSKLAAVWERERAALPAPPGRWSPMPAGLPEKIEPQGKLAAKQEMERASLPAPPSTRVPRPASLPEEPERHSNGELAQWSRRAKEKE